MNLTKNGVTIEVADAQVVDLILERLSGSKSPTDLRCMTLPPIGSYWSGQGGIFAGIMRGRDGGKDYALILGPMLEKGNFQSIQDQAAAVEVDGHKDCRAPFRNEQSLLYANLKDQFEEAWYWSCERNAVFEDYAWVQTFSTGHQLYTNVSDTGLGCAVRAVPIQ